MSAPYLINVRSFDSANGNIFYFRFDGEQSFANKLTIRKNDDNGIVYSQKQSTMNLIHKLEPNILENNTQYNANVVLYGVDGTESEVSNQIVFYCFDSPKDVKIKNITNNQVIYNFEYVFELGYTENKSDKINFYKFVLYDSQHIEIYNTGALYDKSYKVKITNLSDNQKYYIKAFIETIHGIQVSTKEYSFSVDFLQPQNYSIFQLENLYQNGMVKFSSQIISIEGKTEGVVEYIDGKMADLTKGGRVLFENLLLNRDFLIDLQGYKYKPYSTILEIHGNNQVFKLKYMIAKYENSTTEVGFFALYIENDLTTYYQYSNYFTPSRNDTEVLQLQLTRKNGFYRLDVII